MRSNYNNIKSANAVPNIRLSYLQAVKNNLKEAVLTLKLFGLRALLLKVRCRLNPSLIYDEISKFDPKDNYEFEYVCLNSQDDIKVAVYTAIYGDYDTIKEPIYRSPGCDYFIFTDSEIPADSIWQKCDGPAGVGFDEMDAYHKSKFIKMHPHLLFKEYGHSIWVDGTAVIVGDLVPFVDRLKGRCIGMFVHPHRRCVYKEANRVICENCAPYALIKSQTDCYRREGMPEQFGLFEATVIVRRHNDPLCVKLMDCWWHEVTTKSMRDQLSFTYVLWSNSLSTDAVCPLGNNRKDNPRLRFINHKKPQKR